jgi:antitoxin MazE
MLHRPWRHCVRATIRKWGDSLALRLPRAVAQDVNFVEGTEVDVTCRGGRLVVTKAAPKLTLAQLLAGVTPENQHGEWEIETGDTGIA